MLAAFASLAGAEPRGEPRVECARAEHDFGTVEEGAVLAHEFRLAVSGSAAITSVRPTCGCIVARVEIERSDGSRAPYAFDTPIEAESAVAVVAQLDTKAKRNVASGKLIVASNDARGALVLSLTARVEPHFRVTPDTLEFGDLAQGASARRSCEVQGKESGAFSLALAHGELPDGVEVALTPIDADGEGRARRWSVSVALGPGCRDGSLAYPLALTSDQPIASAPSGAGGRRPTWGATVMITATIRGPISFDPAYLAFGLVRPGASAERVLAVRTDDPGFTFPAEPGVRLTHARGEGAALPFADCFSPTVERSPDGKSLTVRLAVGRLPEHAVGPFQGRLVLATGHPRRPEIVVTFAGVCRR